MQKVLNPFFYNKLIKFIYSEKATKICEISTLLCLQVLQTKVRWRFRNILWPSRNVRTLPKLVKKGFLESVWHWNFLSFLKDWKITNIIGRKCRFQCLSNFRTVFGRANGRLKIYPVKQGSTQLRFLPLLALVISLVPSPKCRHYRKKIDIDHVHLEFTKCSLILSIIYLKNTACFQLKCFVILVILR